MDWVVEPERRVPVVADVEVLVCGGGFAGVGAALAAAQNGAKVLLLERYGFLGGLCTGALVLTTPPLDNGINIEFARRLKEKNVFAPSEALAGEVKLIDPEILKYEFVNMLQEQGVDILLHTFVVGALMEENSIRGVIIESKAGRQAIRAKMLVDATGDADVVAFAGAPFREFRKPMTMMFNIVGVNTAKALAKLGNWGNLRNVVKEATERGELSFDLGIYWEFEAPGVNAANLLYDGELNVWAGNLMGMSGIDPRDLTKAEIATREHAMRLATYLKKNFPGFENSRIECTSTQVGVRATRLIVGEASPTMEDVENKLFDDTVVKPYAKQTMRLPYGSILPQKVENLLVAGRCISAHEDAMAKLRLLPVCSATGQTAGTAVALALKQGVTPRRLDVSLLQKTLMEQKMDLGLARPVAVHYSTG